MDIMDLSNKMVTGSTREGGTKVKSASNVRLQIKCFISVQVYAQISGLNRGRSRCEYEVKRSLP